MDGGIPHGFAQIVPASQLGYLRFAPFHTKRGVSNGIAGRDENPRWEKTGSIGRHRRPRRRANPSRQFPPSPPFFAFSVREIPIRKRRGGRSSLRAALHTCASSIVLFSAPSAFFAVSSHLPPPRLCDHLPQCGVAVVPPFAPHSTPAPLTPPTLLHGRPWKLVLVRTGNFGLKSTRQMFETHLPAIEAALVNCTLVELDQQKVSARP